MRVSRVKSGGASAEVRILPSVLDWTIARAPELTDGAPTGRYRAGVGLRFTSFFPQLSRADVAAFPLGEALSPEYETRGCAPVPTGHRTIQSLTS